MAFEKITENVENISLLADTPAMTSNELKAEFDKGNKTIKTKFNEFIDSLNNFITTLATKTEVKGTILYENTTGTSGDITLTDNAENYDYIEIYYGTTVRGSSLKVNNFTNKNLVLPIMVVTNINHVIITKTISISGNTITAGSTYQYNSNSGYSATEMEIYKVVGYKY